MRLVLHRGVEKRDATRFAFDDPQVLARWPSPDRGVARFADRAAVLAVEAPLAALVARWVAQTT